MLRTCVAIICGGQSGEHEVSLHSAASIYQALDKTAYEVSFLGIDRTGVWHLGEDEDFILHRNQPRTIHLNETSPVVTLTRNGQHVEIMSLATRAPLKQIDVVFPIIHGTYGEDGCLQGLLELLNVAYVGSGVTASAISMDKDVMKRLLRAAGLPVTPFVSATKDTLSSAFINEMVAQLGWPIFVKPSNLGSSVGISKVTTLPGLEKAMGDALRYDEKILFEKAVVGREIECGVLGNHDPIASAVGEVRPKDEFYTYQAKYSDGFLEVDIPALITTEIAQQAQSLAVQAFQIVGATGMARVDFFVRNSGEIVINELNTLPGFTQQSVYPKLWQASGVEYPQLLDQLIQLAFERKRNRDDLIRTY